MSYYATGSWGGNQYSPFTTPGASGGFGGNSRVGSDTFQSPFGSDYYDSAGNGSVGYEQFANAMTGQGVGDTGGKFGSWLRSRFPTEWNAYGAAQGKDQNLKWSDFLTNNQDNLQNDYLHQNAFDRGVSSQKNLKWL